MNRSSTRRDRFGVGSVGTLALDVPADEADRVHIAGLEAIRYRHAGPDGRPLVRFLAQRHNAFTNQGLERALDLLFEDTQGALTGISHIALSGDSSAVTAATTDLDPGAAGSSIKPVQNVARTGQTTHGDATWTEADVAFPIRKIGFLYGASTASVVNIIGGQGGTAPYDEDFTVDLTQVGAWTLTFGIDLTASAT